MLIYLIKTILIQAFGLAIYFAFLRNEKLFGHSRKFLWSVVTCSLIIPLIQIPLFSTPEILVNNVTDFITLPEIQVGAVEANSFPFMQVLVSLVFSISSLQCIRLLFSYRKIMTIKNSATSHKHNIYFSETIDLPFSFLGVVYLPTSYKNIEALPIIIAHEQVHIEKLHSMDKIIISFLSRLFWFNPLFILLHKELELIHEFQVDDKVAQDYTLDSYLESFLESAKLIQSNPLILTHSFFSSPIKNRIIMLYKKSKNEIRKKSLSIVMLIVVLTSILFIQCQGQNVSPKNNNIEVIKFNDKDTVYVEGVGGNLEMRITERAPLEIYNFITIQPEYPGGDTRLKEYLSENLKYPTKAKDEKVQGKVVVEFIIDKRGQVIEPKVIKSIPNGEDLSKEALRVINKMPNWVPARHEGKDVATKMQLPISFKL